MSSKSTEMLRIGWTASLLQSFHWSLSLLSFIHRMMCWRFGFGDSFTMFCRFSFFGTIVWFNRRHYFQREPNYHTWHSTVVQTNFANCARGPRGFCCFNCDSGEAIKPHRRERFICHSNHQIWHGSLQLCLALHHPCWHEVKLDESMVWLGIYTCLLKN